MRRFATSNTRWINPHEPTRRSEVAKHGVWDMIYKSEHVTGLESRVIVTARFVHETIHKLPDRRLVWAKTMRPC